MLKTDKPPKHILKDPAKRRAWIIYQVNLQGRSLAQVARDAGVTRVCLYQVFNKTYPRMEKVVADALGMAPAELWPERYDADGLPIYRRGRPANKSITKNTPSSASRNVSASHSDKQRREVA